MPQNNLGRVAFKFKGEYSPGTTYTKYDVVFDGESSYVSLVDSNTGNLLTDATKWEYLAKGNALLSEQNALDIAQTRADLNAKVNKPIIDNNEFTIYKDNDDYWRLMNDKFKPGYIHSKKESYNGSVFYLVGETMYKFTKDGTIVPSQVAAEDSFFFREMNNIHFDCYLSLFNDGTAGTHTNSVEFMLKKVYPNTSNETSFIIEMRSDVDYSSASATPIKKTITNAMLGNIDYYIDDYILENNNKYIHITIDVEIPIRYGNLEIKYKNNGWIVAGSSLKISSSMINPILTTTDKFICDYLDGENYAHPMLYGAWSVTGNGGLVSGSPVKSPFKISSYYNLSFEIVNDKIDVTISDTSNVIDQSNTYNSLFRCSAGYYFKPFDKTKKMYFDFGINRNDLLYINYVRNYSTTILDYKYGLTIGAKLGVSNDYPNVGLKIIDINGEIVRVRLVFSIPNDGVSLSNRAAYPDINFVGTTNIKSIKMYDVCISNVPLNPTGSHVLSNSKSSLLGKSMSLIGDSEFNTMEQIIDTIVDLNMSAKDGHYGGHSWGWYIPNKTQIDFGWFYFWDYRNQFLNNKSDYYVLCSSTNDNPYLHPQLITDESINNVRANYPYWGDDSTTISNKLILFNSLSDNEKYSIFNYASCMCAYIEQIFAANKKAKIAVSNHPITVSGYLSGNLSADNRGVWGDGKNPYDARNNIKNKFDKHDEIVRLIAKRYGLPVLDFYHETGLTFENITEFCVDGTHWWVDEQTYVDGSISVLRNNHVIPMRESDVIKNYIKNHIK